MVWDGCNGAERVQMVRSGYRVGAKGPGCIRIELVKVEKIVRQVGKKIAS